jgi:hypothetical protein
MPLPSSGAKRPRQETRVDDLESDKYSPQEILDLRAESQVAHGLGLSWPERGPPGEKGDTWRGQEYRESSGSFANRGGKAKDWYSSFYKAKAKGKDALDKFMRENPKP